MCQQNRSRCEPVSAKGWHFKKHSFHGYKKIDCNQH